MAVFMFMKHLAPKVRDGSKRHTVRRRRKRRTKPGEMLSLREWEDKPYRSKQITIREEPCVSVKPITIKVAARMTVVILDGKQLSEDELHAFAINDGLESAYEFLEFFTHQYGLPFEGDVTYW